MSKRLFKNEELQNEFELNGFVRIPFLDAAKVEEIKAHYESLPKGKVPEYGFHISLDKEDKDVVKNEIEYLKQATAEAVSEHFEDPKVFTASFVIKETNPKGVVPAHQDWTFVDEKEYCSVTCWIPLVDVNIDNGALGVIRGSHKFYEFTRCSPSPQSPTPIAEQMFTLFPYMHTPELKAGEALVFDNRTMHASPPNVTDSPRVAVGIGITQQDAKLFHHYLLPGGEEVEHYEIDETFFHRYNNGMLSDLHSNGKRPEDLNSLGRSKFEMPTVDSDRLLEQIKEAGGVMNVELVEKLAKLFNYNVDGTKRKESPESTVPSPEPVAEAPRKKSIWQKIFG